MWTDLENVIIRRSIDKVYKVFEGLLFLSVAIFNLQNKQTNKQTSK